MINLSSLYQPTTELSESQRNRGLRAVVWQGVTATAIFSIVNSGFLASYALALGANNFQIGILASLPFIMQPFQIPAILLVEKLRLRKLIASLTWYPSQLVWLGIGLIPFVVDVPSGLAMSMLLGLMALRGVLIAFMSTGWNSWMRDLIPRESMGRFFSRRLAYSTAASIVFGLGGAFFIDFWTSNSTGDQQILGYSFVLLFGYITLGLTSSVFVSMVPEPRMPPVLEGQPNLLKMLGGPLRDPNYKHLVRFLFLWGFVSYLAIPFFPVYMLVRLELPLSAVIGFTTLGQVFYIIFLRVWGPMADTYGYKVVLSLSISLVLLVILGWTFTTMPERYPFTIPLLIILHALWGIASAGANLAVDTIGLKLAPQGKATAYLVAASIATSLGAALGPLLGGQFVDFFSERELAFDITWISPTQNFNLPALHLTGYDFLFAIAFILGLVVLNTLNALREEGEVSREAVLDELASETRQITRSFNAIPGLGLVTSVPYSYLRHIPGVDVAVSVTAYEIATAANAAVAGAVRGGANVAGIADRVRHSMSHAARRIHLAGHDGAHIARDTFRGAYQAADEASADVSDVAKGTLNGVINALRDEGILKVEDALRDAGYGAIQGAYEVGFDLRETTQHVIQNVRAEAKRLEIPEDEAVNYVAQGVLEAAEDIGPEAVRQVKDALVGELLQLPSAQGEAQDADSTNEKRLIDNSDDA